MGMMRLFSVLLDWSSGIRFARSTIVLASVTGILAGVGSTALVAAINTALQGRGAALLGLQPAAVFTVLCAMVPVAGLVSQLLLIRLASRATHDLRLRMAERISTAPYRAVEAIGPSRLLAALTDDVASVTSAITSLPVLLMQLGIIGGCLAYLGWLSWHLLAGLVVYMGLGIATHTLPMGQSMVHFRRIREEWDRMFEGFRGLTAGAKELKLNEARRQAFVAEQLRPAVEAIRHANVWANGLSLAAGNWGQALFFVFIGLVVFVAPGMLAATTGATAGATTGATSGYALTILFMITPLTIIIHTMPTFARALVAADKVQALGLSLESHTEEAHVSSPASQSWRRLELAGVTYTYGAAGSAEAFQVGPLELVLERGELVFMIGGNGSGKTTLTKLVTGLYEPQGGEVRLDGRPVLASERAAYRQMFSAVFSDYHLFSRLVGPGEALEERGRELLVKLQLADKVTIERGVLSTLELSQGQRKRLALLLAYLEDRPIYVFDEWAADQDPVFREIFYRRLLPELRDRGKAILVITHDDRYFDVADRIIKLERGRIELDAGPRVRAVGSA